MDQKLKELKREVRCLLEDHEEGINVNSFWGCYERKYCTLPDPKVFKVRKRSEILDLCSDVCRKVGFGGAAMIHLRSSGYSDQQQSHVSRVTGGAVGGKEKEQVQPQVSKPQSSAETWNARQATPTQAGMNELTAGGSFYDRFYSQSSTDTHSIAKAGSGARNVANPASHGSYSSLMGPRPAAASYAGNYVERFAVPIPLLGWNTPPASLTPGSQRYQTPRSRDSSGSRSSDGAPGGQHTGPRAVPIPVPAAASASMTSQGIVAARGRRTNLSREQLNSAAEDCIDRLSVAKDYVSLEKIEALLCQDFVVSSLKELSLQHIDQLPCVNEHKRLECKVNAYIQNFVKVCFALQSQHFYLSLDTNLDCVL